MLRHLLRAAALPLVLTTAAQAQTTHDVALFGLEFAPDDLTIAVGDTVRWTWFSGFHNVVSGVDGVSNGIFESALTLPPFTYQVTFDQAFLDANPVPGNVYDYYCLVHLPGMQAKIRVEPGPIGSLTPYGSGLNPQGSVFPGGSPKNGSTTEITLLNPAQAPAGPGLAFLFLATQPDPNFPNGTPIPGWGLAQGQPGELLLSLVPPDPAITIGPVNWAQNASVKLQVPIPADPNLAGRQLFIQGVLFDPNQPEPIGLTDAVELVIG